MSRVHYCQQNFCRELIPVKERYCSEHAKLHKKYSSVTDEQRKALYKSYNNQQRNRQADAFYQGRRWKKVRDTVFVRDMATCQVCGNVLQIKIVDHIVRRDLLAGLEQYDMNNLWCLCGRCHNSKTKLEQSMLAKPNGKNKLKHISKDNWIKYIKERMNNENKR
ncbi:MAG: HNH endonuclease [Liquorilactobacillus hordei]|uniref:HNH endonuclease n=1 Tax=Liquorilactobacillus hordei TaxID=468911 RepID=UPI0039E90995